METDNDLGPVPRVVATTFLLIFLGSLDTGADEGVLRMGAGTGAVLATVPNFFGGRDGNRATRDPGTGTADETLGSQSDDGVTPASVKNCWSFLTTAAG